MKTITISKLKVGQRFSFVPAQWFGAAKLIYKKRRWDYVVGNGVVHKIYKYDIKFDAKVVNPPGIEYGIASDTKVRLLKKKR